MRVYRQFFSLLAVVPCVLSLPASVERDTIISTADTVTPLSADQVNDYIPYAWFSAASYCPQPSQATWTCRSCQADSVKDLVIYASGGDGANVQFWYVGYWPSKQSIVVSHQGTSVNIAPVLRDATFIPVPIDPTRFPGAPLLTTVHAGFQDGHGLTADKILVAVKKVIADKGATKVTTVGHSLGGALAVLEGLYLKLNLPSHIQVNTRTFGQPRASLAVSVGNDVFARFVDSTVPNLARVTRKGDVVPVLPTLIMLYRHSSGEKHENAEGHYNACAGRDNTDVNCSTGQIIERGLELRDHLGPYPGGVMIGPPSLGGASLC